MNATERNGAWTEEEDLELARLQKKHGNRWALVSEELKCKTGQQCAQRWRHKVNPNIRKEKWSEEEDAKLAELYEMHGQKWAKIASHLEGRTDQQCMGRWRRHLDPNIKKDAWSKAEDAKLADLHRKMGSCWSAISKLLTGRTAQQCRARWYQVHFTGDNDDCQMHSPNSNNDNSSGPPAADTASAGNSDDHANSSKRHQQSTGNNTKKSSSGAANSAADSPTVDTPDNTFAEEGRSRGGGGKSGGGGGVKSSTGCSSLGGHPSEQAASSAPSPAAGKRPHKRKTSTNLVQVGGLDAHDVVRAAEAAATSAAERAVASALAAAGVSPKDRVATLKASSSPSASPRSKKGAAAATNNNNNNNEGSALSPNRHNMREASGRFKPRSPLTNNGAALGGVSAVAASSPLAASQERRMQALLAPRHGGVVKPTSSPRGVAASPRRRYTQHASRRPGAPR